MAEKTLGKHKVIREIMHATGLMRDQVKAVLDKLEAITKRELATTGEFVLLGLVRMRKGVKQGHKGGIMLPDLKNPGQFIETQPKPPKNVVRCKALKPLRKMV